MQPFVRKFASFAEEQAADREFWAAMSPEQRVEVLESIRQESWKITGERLDGLRRVIQVLERPRS